METTDVLVIGAGPVGLTLAIDLGQRGIKAALIERNEKPLFAQKWNVVTREPLLVLLLDQPALREPYQRDYLLLRPGLYVAWRGNALPSDPEKVAARVTGNRT
ncbi:MAG: FAD-dependent monooxygenase [Immundisolibacteraceae bacterium]|nr:FAD-dependent monooxygenase [Immundisolibacteraceae bacterium]